MEETFVPDQSLNPLLQSLPVNSLSSSMESRVAEFLRKVGVPNNIKIRVCYSVDKVFKRKPLLATNYNDKMEFPYREKLILVFQEPEGKNGISVSSGSISQSCDSSPQPVIIFGFVVQEYYSDCPAPNTNSVYLAYVDSVNFYRHKEHRTALYHQILLGYLAWARDQGLNRSFIWVCPPTKGSGDYLLNQKPANMRTPSRAKLLLWYKKLFANGKGIIDKFMNLSKHLIEVMSPPPTSVIHIPYFEGDFWPMRIEELIQRKKKNVRSLGGNSAFGEQNLVKSRRTMAQRKKKNVGSRPILSGVDSTFRGESFAKSRRTMAHRKIKKKRGKFSMVETLQKRLTVRLDNVTKGVLQDTVKKSSMFLVVNLLRGPEEIIDSCDPDPTIEAPELFADRTAFVNLCIENNWTFDSLKNAKDSTANILKIFLQSHKLNSDICSMEDGIQPSLSIATAWDHQMTLLKDGRRLKSCSCHVCVSLVRTISGRSA